VLFASSRLYCNMHSQPEPHQQRNILGIVSAVTSKYNSQTMSVQDVRNLED